MVVAGKCSFLRVPFVLGGKFCSGEEKHFVLWIPPVVCFLAKGPVFQANAMPFSFKALSSCVCSIAGLGAVSCWNRIAVVVVQNWGFWIGLLGCLVLVSVI